MKTKNRAAIALRVSIALSMLAALSIILGKFLQIPVGDTLRFSFENLPTIFAGITFGPFGGVTVGVLADLVGCLMAGYTINPILTVGAGCIGFFSGCAWWLLGKVKLPMAVRLAISELTAHLIGSVLIKSIGLSVFYGMPFEVLIVQRLGNYLVVGVAEGIVLYFLLRSKMIQNAINIIKRGGKK